MINEPTVAVKNCIDYNQFLIDELFKIKIILLILIIYSSILFYKLNKYRILKVIKKLKKDLLK